MFFAVLPCFQAIIRTLFITIRFSLSDNCPMCIICAICTMSARERQKSVNCPGCITDHRCPPVMDVLRWWTLQYFSELKCPVFLCPCFSVYNWLIVYTNTWIHKYRKRQVSLIQGQIGKKISILQYRLKPRVGAAQDVRPKSRGHQDSRTNAQRKRRQQAMRVFSEKKSQKKNSQRGGGCISGKQKAFLRKSPIYGQNSH